MTVQLYKVQGARGVANGASGPHPNAGQQLTQPANVVQAFQCNAMCSLVIQTLWQPAVMQDCPCRFALRLQHTLILHYEVHTGSTFGAFGRQLLPTGVLL